MKKIGILSMLLITGICLTGCCLENKTQNNLVSNPTTMQQTRPVNTKQTAGRDNLGGFAPKFAELNDDVLFGEVWSREDKLDAHQRSLITISALIGAGTFDQLPAHINLGKQHGITKNEIIEVVTHLAFYTGWPKAWTAFPIVKEVYADEIAADPQDPYAEIINAEPSEPQTAGRTILGEFAPKFAELNDDVLFGEIWSREEQLDLHQRSLITISALIGAGMFDQVRAHITLGKQHGITQEEISEVITHLAFYAGWPKAWSAFTIAKEIYSEN